MSKRLTDILPKISQYEVIEYAGDLECPECGKSGIGCCGRWTERPDLVGWCETSRGYMCVFECPVCGKKYRFHSMITKGASDIDAFEIGIRSLLGYVKNCNELLNVI
ncbi:MAG: hypothetical protein J6X18_01175 [Bacteroidales bacterium]|nr:hypothetical protein [Bacteroidales bacterium]